MGKAVCALLDDKVGAQLHQSSSRAATPPDYAVISGSLLQWGSADQQQPEQALHVEHQLAGFIGTPPTLPPTCKSATAPRACMRTCIVGGRWSHF